MNERINVLYTFDDYVFAGTESGRIYRWKVQINSEQYSGNILDTAKGITHLAPKKISDVAQWQIQPCFTAISALHGTRNNRLIYPKSRQPVPSLNLAIGTVSGDFFIYRGDILLQHMRLGSYVREICSHKSEFIIGDIMGFMYAVTTTGLSYKRFIAISEGEKTVKSLRTEPSTAALESFRMLDVERTESTYVAASMNSNELVLTHQGQICSIIHCPDPIISLCCLTEENATCDVLLAATKKGGIYQLVTEKSKRGSSRSDSNDFHLHLAHFTEMDFLVKEITSVDLIEEQQRKKMYWICLGFGGNVAFMCERDVIYKWRSVSPHDDIDRPISLAQVSFHQQNAVTILLASRDTIIGTEIEIDTLEATQPHEKNDEVLAGVGKAP
ncbi:hypothetical protein ABG067_007169 [Albugo candida]